MRDQPPLRKPALGRPNGFGRFGQTSDPRKQRRAFNLKITFSPAERQPSREVAVRARRFHIQHLDRRNPGIEVHIYERHEHFRSFVVLALGLTSNGVPKRLFCLLPVSMSKRIEWREVTRRPRLRIACEHFIDRIDLSACLPMNVRDHLIFILLLRKIDRVCQSRKQIDDRRTAHSKCISRDGRGRRRYIFQVDQNVEMTSKFSLNCLIDTVDIKKQKLIRESEIFGQQPIPRERTLRVWKHRLIFVETNLPQCLCSRYDHGIRQFQTYIR